MKNKNRLKLNPMVRQVSRLIDPITSSKKKIEEIKEHLQQVVDPGAKEGSDEHFIATKLNCFHASFLSICAWLISAGPYCMFEPCDVPLFMHYLIFISPRSCFSTAI